MIRKKLKFFVAFAAFAAVGGCALQQKISLAQPDPVSPSADVAIEVIDLRDDHQKTTHIAGHPHCLRSYGDDFIAPSKIAYFRRVIESRAAPHTHANLAIGHFETLEFCDTMAAEVVATAITAVTGAPAFPVEPKGAAGDTFVLHVDGKINGAPFDIVKSFDYHDVKYFNFPSESPQYRQRVERALQSAAEEILAAGTKPTRAS